jgi:hypothetical protein
LYGESLGKLASSGKTEALLDVSLKLNLLNFIPAVAAFNKGLKKTYSSVGAGVIVKPGCLVRLRPLGLFYDKHYYAFSESALGSTINVPGNQIIPLGKTVPTRLRVTHGFSFGLYAGVYFEVSLIKFVSFGVEATFDVLKKLNIEVGTLGSFNNNVPYRGMTASSAPEQPKPRVVFHKA